MAKYLDLTGLKYFITKRIGKTDISKIGDGTCTGAISALNQSLSNNAVLFKKIKRTDIKQPCGSDDTWRFAFPKKDNYTRVVVSTNFTGNGSSWMNAYGFIFTDTYIDIHVRHGYSTSGNTSANLDVTVAYVNNNLFNM